MNSQLLLTVSQIHQQELRQAACEARAANQHRTRRFAISRRFRINSGTRGTAPAISVQPRTV